MRKYNLSAGRHEIEKTRSLRNININEISLVNKPANKRLFLFFKSGDNKMYDDALDLLDAIEQIENSFELSKDENKRIETCIKALNKLDSNEVGAISGVLLLLSELTIKSIPEEKEKPDVEKSVSPMWPSFCGDDGFLVINKAKTDIDIERAKSNGSKWPSFACVED
jgi:hypothetical protein